jgi:acyl carrier protein phosphodiesterase
VNFFGHATVACWRKPKPCFVLGAMLPDFERMIARRAGDLDDAELIEGIRWHHRTDAAFHDCPTFVALCRSARAELRRHGLPRGATMAVAHVGIELLLDGLLLGDEEVERAYLQALQVAGDPDCPLRWSSEADAARFEALRARLLEAGAPTAYRDPSVVAERLARITSARPRLAFDARLVPDVRQWTNEMRHELERFLPTLLDELENRL